MTFKKENFNKIDKTYDIILKSNEEDKYKFEGIASSYGNVDSYGDVFLDGSLDDNLGKTIPIMPNHSWDILKTIGYGKLEKQGSNIIIKGEFIKNDEVAEKIVNLKAVGVPICLSIGGRVLESKPYSIKGATYRGITKAEIIETSVVLKGANPKAKITKEEKGVEEMEEILKQIKELKDAMKKNSETEERNKIEKAIEKLTEMLKSINGLSEEDKAKLEKAEKLEEDLKKVTEELDKLMKAGTVNTEKNDEFAKFEKELNDFFKRGIETERIKKSFDTTAGGVSIPDNRAKEIIKQIKETSPVLNDAKMYSITKGDNLTVPVKNAGTNNTAKQGEGAERGTESTMAYGKLELKVDKLTTWVNVTSEMIEDSDFNVVSEVNETAREYIADYLSQKVWNGETSDNLVGIYKTTEVTSGALETATASTVTWEDLDKLIMSLPPTLRAKSTLYVSTSMLTAMRTFKDLQGRPLYTESLIAGTPALYRGYRVKEDVFMDEVGDGKYPAFFGDMSKFYAWLNRKGVYMEKDRKAGNDTYDFYTRIRIGGKVRDKSQGKLLKVKGA